MSRYPGLPLNLLTDSLSWDSTYATEIANHASNPDDSGTIWFDDSDAETKILDYLSSLAEEGLLDARTSRFLDLGTGNGHMLLELLHNDWQGEMVGVDYSEPSVQLAKQIAAGKNVSSVKYWTWDILGDVPGEWLHDGFDVVLDKGTFDAISLSTETDVLGRRACEGYREKIERLIRVEGFLLVTSCNWTKEELKQWFDEGGLKYWGKVEYPSFTFGGMEGQAICTLCFKRKAG